MVNTYGDDIDRVEATLLQERYTKARKDHTCSSCRGTILRGQSYRRQFWLLEGDPYIVKTCMSCRDEEYVL